MSLQYHRLVNEFAYSHPFYFIAAILVHILTPKAFPVLLIYFYAMTMGAQVLGTLMSKPMLQQIIFVVQSAILFLLYIAIMADNWCRFYLYRGHA